MKNLSRRNARMMAVIFGVAMSWASVCSTMCALGVCPEEMLHIASRASSTASSSPSMPSNPAVPEHQEHGPECAMHGHPSVFAEKTPALSFARPGITGRTAVPIDQLTALAAVQMPAIAELSGLSDMAPPGTAAPTPPKQILVLRI